jgi:hypothetical protein
MEQKSYITDEERRAIKSFEYERKREHDRNELNKQNCARLRGEVYEPQPFAGVDEEIALDAVRRGWKSPLQKAFEKKSKKEGWK